MTGPHAEQSVGFRQGSGSAAPVMTEQAFTLAMNDLRLDVGHEEGSSKEFPGLAYEHVSLGLLSISACFYERDEASAKASPDREEDAQMTSFARGGDGAFLGFATGRW
eukprot:6210835-Pleurochrysis_carterae.AAC.3